MEPGLLLWYVLWFTLRLFQLVNDTVGGDFKYFVNVVAGLRLCAEGSN